MAAAVPSVTLRTGQVMPALALGTWQSKKGEVGAALKHAIAAGYRHIDCASNYLNEDEIGDTLEELFAADTVKREDLWITSKLNNPYHHRKDVKPHLLKTLKDLKLEYLDLWLIHWPVAFKYVPYDENTRGFHASYDPDGCSELPEVKAGESKLDMTVSIRETWEAMEECVEEGLVKAIGLCNVTAPLVWDVLTYARIKPAVVQNEMHPYLQQPALCTFLANHGIISEAYSPLGTSGFKKPGEPTLLDDPTIKEIARKHGVTPAQVALGWAIQRGTVPLPKSTNKSRIEENIETVNKVRLGSDDMAAIAKLDRNYHYLRPNDWYGVPLFAS